MINNRAIKSLVTASMLAFVGMACTPTAEDINGPNIHILGIIEGNPVTVQGYVTDQTGIDAFTINNQFVAIDANNRFIVSIPSAPLYELRAVDTLGFETAETLARRDQKFNPTIAFRLNQSGINFMTEEMANSVNVSSFEDQIAGQEVLPEQEIDDGIWGTSFYMWAKIQSVSYSKPDVNLTLTDNEHFLMDMTIPNMRTVLVTRWKLCFIGICGGWNNDGATVTANSVHFTTNAGLSIVNSLVDINLANTHLDFNNLNYDWNSIGGGFENFVNGIIYAVQNTFVNIYIAGIERIAVPVMSKFIEDMPINTHVQNSEGERISSIILPYNLDTYNGGATIELKGTIFAPTIAGVPGPYLGSYYVPGASPQLTEVTNTGKSYDIGVMIGTNLINQAFLAGHESGQTTMVIDASKNAGVSPNGVDVITQPSDDIIATDKLRFRITPISPPYFYLTGNKDDQAVGVFGMKDFSLSYEVKRLGWPDWTALYSATLDVEADFTLGTQDNGNLHVGLEKLPRVVFKSFSNGGPIRLSPVFLNNMVRFFMPLAMPVVGATLDSVATPTIAGFGIKAEEFWTTGENNTHLAMAGTMVKVSDTATAPAPETNVNMVSNEAGPTMNESVTILNGVVTLNFSGINPSPGELEYRYRLDGSEIWSNWSNRATVTLANLLGGLHRVDVCSRTSLLKQDPSCAIMNFETKRL